MLFRSLPEIGKYIPSSWAKMQDWIADLRKEGVKSIAYDDYYKQCKEIGLVEDSVTAPKTLIGFLHRTGEVFYQVPLFAEKIIIDQQWAIEAIYTLLDRDEFFYEFLERGDGGFTLSDLQEVWGKYTNEEQELFLQFMESCEIVFCKDEYRTKKSIYIAPQLLSAEKPFDIERLEKLASFHTLVYQYPFLHQSIVIRFIVRMGNMPKASYWRNGICYEQDGHTILVEAFDKDNQIHLKIAGAQPKQCLEKVRKVFKEIQENIEFEEFVFSEGGALIPLSRIVANYGQTERFVLEGGECVVVGDYGVFVSKQNSRPTHKIFIAYAQKDLPHVETLESHLSPILQNQNITKLWTKQELLAGQNLQEIERKMEESTIILLMVSSDFLASDMWQKLRQKLVQKNEGMGVRIVPVVVRKCAWEYEECLGQLKPVSYGGKSLLEADNVDVAFCEAAEAIWAVVEG